MNDEVEVNVETKPPVNNGGDNLLSLASHELRTTLSIIKWYTEMLLDGDSGPLTEEQTKYLKTIESSNQRAIDLIRSLLNVSRLDLDTFSISPVEVDLSKTVKQVLNDYRVAIETKKLQIMEEYSEEVEGKHPVFLGDKQMCLVIVRSLISNAVIFSKEGSSVRIKTSMAKKDEEFVSKKIPEDSFIVTVSDNGIGIPEKEKEKIFSKLFKASNTKDSDSNGAGLSLYITSSILNKTGGSIWFDSIEGQGSNFYVAFPVSGIVKKEGKTTLD